VLNTFRYAPLAAAVIAVLSGNTAADEKGNTFTLNKVTVAATRTEQKTGKVASTVSVIDQDSIESSLSGNIRDVIRYQPGVEVGNGSGDAARFGAKGFNIRGMDENRVKITVDGVDMANAFTPQGNPFQRAGRNYVDIDTMKRIEIVKGPASTLYGSDALGGLVAYTTKDPADYLVASGDDFAGTIKLRSGTVDAGFSQTLALAKRSGKLESLLIYTNRDAEERENHDDSDNNVDKQDFDSDNLLVKLQYSLNDQQQIGLTLEDYQSDSYTDISSKLAAPYYSDFYYGDDNTQRQRASLIYQRQANNSVFDEANWQLDWQDSKIVQQTHTLYGTAQPVYRIKDYRQHQEVSKLSAQFAKGIENHQLIYGFEYQQTELSNDQNTRYPTNPAADTLSRAVPLVEADNYGIYLQDTIDLLDGKLTVTPGVRYDSFTSEPKTDSSFIPPDAATSTLTGHDSDKLTFRIGSVYQLSDLVSVFGQYSQGFKAPDPLDLYYASERNYGPGYHYLTLPNPDLEAEESDSYELGLRMAGKLGNFEAVVFYNNYSNFIEDAAIDRNVDGVNFDSVTQSQNIEEASIKGAEIRASMWLDEALNAPSGMSLQVSIAYADGENDTNDKPLESISPMKAVIGLGYDRPNNVWGGALNWTLVKSKSTGDLENPDDFSTAGYGTLDLTSYYNINKNLIVRSGLFNITDKQYWVYEDMRNKSAGDSDLDKFTQPGINFTASMNYQF